MRIETLKRHLSQSFRGRIIMCKKLLNARIKVKIRFSQTGSAADRSDLEDIERWIFSLHGKNII